MPQTPTYGFEFETPQSKPGITLTGDINGSSPILAEQVETALAGVDARVSAAEGDIAALQAQTVNDSGWIPLSVTAAGGYSVTLQQYRHWGPIVSIMIDLTRTGGAFPANSAGNVTDTTVCTINTVAARPSQQTHCLFNATVTSGTMRISTAGVVTIVDMHSNSVLSTDDAVRIVHTYFVSTTN
jgi:hypothetical protein